MPNATYPKPKRGSDSDPGGACRTQFVRRFRYAPSLRSSQRAISKSNTLVRTPLSLCPKYALNLAQPRHRIECVEAGDPLRERERRAIVNEVGKLAWLINLVHEREGLLNLLRRKIWQCPSDRFNLGFNCRY